MTDLRTRPVNGRKWRAYLTPEERRRLGVLDRLIAKLTPPIANARRERQTIQNRASVRFGRDIHK
jgi:hypothetical protein